MTETHDDVPPTMNDSVTLDWPGTLTPEDDWESVWPKSHKVWNLVVPFQAIGHTKEQALTRYEQFTDTLNHLLVESDGLHPLIEFIFPEFGVSVDPILREEEIHHSFPMGSMASGGLEFYWDYWHPDSTADYNVKENAAKLRASQWYETAQEERLADLMMLLANAVRTGDPLPTAAELLAIITGETDHDERTVPGNGDARH